MDQLIGDTMPYQIIFYEKSNGKSDVWDFLEQLHFTASFSEKEPENTSA